MTRHGVERFPSLVEAALEPATARWQRTEAAIQALEEAREPELLDIPQDTEDAIARRYDSRGGSFSAIGREFGVSADAVREALRAARTRRHGEARARMTPYRPRSNYRRKGA